MNLLERIDSEVSVEVQDIEGYIDEEVVVFAFRRIIFCNREIKKTLVRKKINVKDTDEIIKKKCENAIKELFETEDLGQSFSSDSSTPIRFEMISKDMREFNFTPFNEKELIETIFESTNCNCKKEYGNFFSKENEIVETLFLILKDFMEAILFFREQYVPVEMCDNREMLSKMFKGKLNKKKGVKKRGYIRNQMYIEVLEMFIDLKYSGFLKQCFIKLFKIGRSKKGGFYKIFY